MDDQSIKSIITIIQVYAPMTEAEENEIESFYESIQEEIDHTPKRDIPIVIGDWDSKVETKGESNVVRKFGLRVRNEARDRLMDICKAINLSITNTYFEQLNRQLYTWTSQDEKMPEVKRQYKLRQMTKH